MPPRCWIGIASREHVKLAEAGGFCQLGHGRAAPVRRLAPDDGLVWYAPREGMGTGPAVQAFVALGTVAKGDPYVADQSGSFHPTRRAVRYQPCREAPIRPLLARLSFIPDPKAWGLVFRRSLLEIPPADFQRIADAMEA